MIGIFAAIYRRIGLFVKLLIHRNEDISFIIAYLYKIKKDINIIVTKSVSRFCRDTVDTLEALKVIKQASARIIFEQENLDSQEDDTDIIISIMESLAQSENEQRSENIKWGLKQRAEQGTSKLYNRKCCSYDHDGNGDLIINFQQAKIVRIMFNWYLDGKSVIGIVKELEKEKFNLIRTKQMAKEKHRNYVRK